MKKLFRLLVLSANAAILMLPALAQPVPPQAGTTFLPRETSEEEARAALERKFNETSKDDLPTAYKIAKEYLQKYPPGIGQTSYVQRWINSYEALIENKRRRRQFEKLLIEKNFDKAFTLGTEILKAEPKDAVTLYNMAINGLNALIWNNDGSFVADASNYAKRALPLFESGQRPDKEMRIAQLNYALGIFTLYSAPDESVKYFEHAKRLAAFKKDVELYGFMADALLGAEYIPLHNAYNLRFDTLEKKLSPEGKATKAKLDKVADRVVDALAHAVALAGSDPNFAQVKEVWSRNLRDLYMMRNSGYDTGLDKFIEEILDELLPL